MEEHNNITYIPPPQKASEEVPQSTLEERISSDVTKDQCLEQKTESTYSPEKASKVPTTETTYPAEKASRARGIESTYVPANTTRAPGIESTYSPEKASRAPAIESTYSPEKASRPPAIGSTYSPEKARRAPAERDVGLTRIETEKKNSIIKAWEDSEKSKAENKAHKEMSSILSWENAKRAAIEANLRRKEEELEKKRAEYAEKLKNKLAKIHKEAEMKRAHVEAQRGKAFVEAEEKAAKHEATGVIPNKRTWCCGTNT